MLAACVVIVLIGICWFVLRTPQTDPTAIAAAQDEVYSAVVRDMIAHGQTGTAELVFGKNVWTGLMRGTDLKSCNEEAQRDLRLGTSPPPYNSFADKLYRIVTQGYDNYFVRADTGRDFVQKYCTSGRLSETFHTDLPRAFADPETVYMDALPFHRDGLKSFGEVFPGARGIIWFSYVGFDRKLDQAIVFATFSCDGLCGGSWIYVLRKRRGHWKVVSEGTVNRVDFRIFVLAD